MHLRADDTSLGSEMCFVDSGTGYSPTEVLQVLCHLDVLPAPQLRTCSGALVQ